MNRGLRAAVLGAALVVCLPLLAASGPALPAPERTVVLTSHPLPSFALRDHDRTTFGRLRWVGGFELETDTPLARGLSALKVGQGGSTLTAITDGGHMLLARIRRDDQGRPIALAEGRLRPMLPADPAELGGAKAPDAEGLDLVGDGPGATAAVSYETMPRVMTGTIDADGFVGPLTALPLPDDLMRLTVTKGLEALAYAPPGSPLDGRIVVLGEEPVDGGGPDRQGWVLGEPLIRFTVADDGFSLTDARFQNDGTLLLLERRFTLGDGPAMRIRAIAPGAIRDGARVDGPEVIAADGLHQQIDNMEGIDVWTDPQGRVRISLISDDNRSVLQRTLYLEFELQGE